MATTLAPSTAEIVRTCKAVASGIVRIPTRQMWVDYDEEADVLYLSFRKPQRATKTIELDGGDILVRKDGRTVVGVTILNARTKR